MTIETITLSHILGPMGGTIALTWAAGAMSGYIFAMKSIKEKITFLEKQLKMADQVCEARVNSLEERHEAEIETLKELLQTYSYQVSSLQKMIGGGDSRR